MVVAGAQHVGEQILIRLLVEVQVPGHRQIASRVVVTVEAGQLLRTMGRIVRRVQIDRDPLCLALQAPAMPLDHSVGQRNPHPQQIRPIKGVLKARERRREARFSPRSGSRPHSSFWIGSAPNRPASLPSG